MSRLIDANALKKKLFVFDMEFHDGHHQKYYVYKEKDVDAAPTIDAVEVVRCKDCKYMTEHYDTDGNAPYWTCSEWDSGTDYDGFCHLAERRSDE